MQDQSNVRKAYVSAECDRSGVALRAAARSKVAETRRSRMIMAQQLRDGLQLSRMKTRDLVARICSGVTASIYEEGKATNSAEVGAAEGKEQRWDLSAEDELALCVSKQDIVNVIEQHPEGVSLTEIGNELGTDWRELVSWSRRLVVDGKIERLDELFYPARK
jgi:hypothetical protein